MTSPGAAEGDAGLQEQHRSLWRSGTEMIRAGRVREATDQFLHLIELMPTDAAAMVQAAYLLSRQDRYRQSHALALRAAQIGTANAPQCDGAVQIGKLLRMFEEPALLQRLFAATDWSRCGSAHLLTEASGLLINSGLHAEALAMIERAVAADPRYAHGHYMHGSILAAAGEQERAGDALRRAIALAPGAAHAHWMLSWQKRSPDHAGEDDDRIAQVRGLLGKTPLGSEARAYLGYALHNRLHRLQRFDQAWEALQCAMDSKRQANPYRSDEQQQVFEALKALPPPTRPSSDPMRGDPRPIFIVGMHRSGTTLLEQLLAGHSMVTDGGETYTFTAALGEAADHHCRGVVDLTVLAGVDSLDWDAIGEQWRSYARWRALGRAVLTEKLPSNFLNVGLIARALPEARFLHMRRDPIDVCFSNLRTFFGRAAAYSYDQEQVASYYLEYRRLMSHWHAQLPGRILDIDYAELVQDPAARMRGVTDFCGLPFEPGSVETPRRGGSVATASLADVRAEISRDRGGAWRPYAPHLQPLIRALKPARDAQQE
ncbi:MAG: sulfotransferase [Pseudomonadota bacterium]|nr:sulfotransferase [Pseudomonadota bacterium]